MAPWLRFGFLASLVSTGCSAETSMFVALPDIEGVRSYVVVGVGRIIEARNIETPARMPVEGERTGLFLLLYDQTLAEMELEPGRLEPSTRCRACAFAEPTRTFWTSVDPERDAPVWEETILPDTIADLLVVDRARCTDCRSFDSASIPLFGVSSTAMFAVPYDDRSALVGDRNGHFFRVDVDGHTEELCQASALVPTCGYRAEGSSVWLGDASGRLTRLELDRLEPNAPCIAAASTVTPALHQSLQRIDGAKDGSLEIYAMTLTSTLVRYDDDGWTQLGALRNDSNEYGVLWIGPGQAIGVNGSENIIRVDPSSGTSTFQALAGGGGIINVTTAALLPRHGIVLGTQQNRLAFEEAQGWRPATDAMAFLERVDAIVPYGDSILFSVRNGRLGEYRSLDGSYCALSTAFETATVDHLVAFPDGTVIAAAQKVHLVTPRRECSGE